jgi:hypothetical protein
VRAERGLDRRVLDDPEEVPGAHHREGRLDDALLGLDEALDLLEVLRRLLEGLAPFRRELDQGDVREHTDHLPVTTN